MGRCVFSKENFDCSREFFSAPMHFRCFFLVHENRYIVKMNNSIMQIDSFTDGFIRFIFATPVVALMIAVATAIFAFIRFIREQEHQRKTTLNALFAEIANIFEHCVYAANGLPLESIDLFEVKKKLRWAKHGFSKSSSDSALRSAGDIGRLGFLDATNIQLLIQFELKLRNDNLFIDLILEDEKNISEKNLDELNHRLISRIHQAAILLEGLVASKPELYRAFSDLKNQLPIMKILA